MKPIELVPTDAPVTIVATAPVHHLCPFVNEADHGRVTAVWTCNGSTVELHSLAAYLDGFTERSISHEDLVDEVFERLGEAAPDITVASVTARFTTAGITVEISRAVPGHAIGT
jgi:NADPH-dependent 7-cyano-7-deazaguanine reductase QueF